MPSAFGCVSGSVSGAPVLPVDGGLDFGWWPPFRVHSRRIQRLAQARSITLPRVCPRSNLKGFCGQNIAGSCNNKKVYREARVFGGPPRRPGGPCPGKGWGEVWGDFPPAAGDRRPQVWLEPPASRRLTTPAPARPGPLRLRAARRRKEPGGGKIRFSWRRDFCPSQMANFFCP